MPVLVTKRLNLVPFSTAHIQGLHTMNADPEVMRYISGHPETLAQTTAMVERVQRRWAEFGYSWWSLIDRENGEIVGAGALQNLRRTDVAEPDPNCPLEIGWRLRRDRWGQGLASEAAQAIVEFAFGTIRAAELYAVCEPNNVASAHVMQLLGMQDKGLQTWYGRTLLTYQMQAPAHLRRLPPA